MTKTNRSLPWLWLTIAMIAGALPQTHAAPAVLLFEDDFNRGIPGWTAVQPSDTYIDGPMRWQYDIVSGSFVEQSNIYTGAPAGSPAATAVMLINDAVAPTNFTYKARLIAGDDDAFGLIFGYQNANNFYRITFARQNRTSNQFPWNGWNVDRRVNNVSTNLFGDGTPDHVPSFVNTQGQPFDVTVTVAGNNLFSLTVIDDPEGGAIEYKLVESRPLPAPANGRVGLMAWGMSGMTPRGFRIQNPTLEPVALQGDPHALANWTPVVPPRASGENTMGAGNGGQPIWSLALGSNGPYGTLHENSDSFGGNDAEGVIDFVAGSLVAGDVAWTDYMLTARVIPADDDGHGIILRFKDEKNFLRIALRNQSSGTGPRKGLSVQKVVDGVWEEIYRDEPIKYDPVANVPYDISAVIVGNRLQIQIVGDPNGAAKMHSYGPIDITGPTVQNGKIGVFSWAMARTEFDFVRVYQIDGIPLNVSSPFGNPQPAPGLQGFPAGTSVTASVTSPVEEQPGLRRVTTGWTGTGSVPASGTASSVTFTLNEISSLTWNWQTEARLNVTTEPGGTVVAPAFEWIAEGTPIAVTAVPNPGFVFVGWSGDLTSTEPALNVSMTRPLNLTARFSADSDADSLPDDWEQRFFNGLSASATDDPDNDGKTNLAEYRNGTDPTFAEKLVVTDGLNSRWENVQRDPVLPGHLVVRDFGQGFRGVWDNSNDFREAVDGRVIGLENTVPNVSFDGPRIVIRPEVWNPAWTDFTASAVFSVGDNDGNCVYFRYQDELNWYRVTVTGENNDAAWRAPFGVSIQKRVGGKFTEIVQDPSIATDPADTSFYKRIRITVVAQGPNFEVRVAGWDVLNFNPPDWAGEVVLPFTDSDLTSGRFGVGVWGQGGGNTATDTNPVNAGVLIEDVVIVSGGNEVFREDWDQVPLQDQFPEGWTVPQTGTAAGDWRVSAHGTIMQLSNYGPSSSGTTANPKADADATILLAPAPGVANYLFEVGFHPFDNDGIGFVYDYADLNNYSRVLFVSEGSGNGRVPQGVNVSRIADGVWSDVIVGDSSFVYQVGRPFAVEFFNHNGEFQMIVRDRDSSALLGTWNWSGPAAPQGHRIGLTCWGETDAHFLYARATSRAPRASGGQLQIGSISISGGNIVLEVSNPGNAPYNVETSPSLAPNSWTVIAQDETGAQWTSPLPSTSVLFYRIRRN